MTSSCHPACSIIWRRRTRDCGNSRRVLAPHGVISLMVYGTHGREPFYRMVRAIDLLVARDRPLAERLAVARRLAREMPAEALRVGPIALDDSISDSEFVDRYLNVNETSYDVATLWGLLSVTASDSCAGSCRPTGRCPCGHRRKPISRRI